MEANTLNILIISAIVLFIAWFFLIGRHFIKAIFSGVYIKPTEVAFMLIRGCPVKLIVSELIRAKYSNVVLMRRDLEFVHLSGGNITNVVDGMIYAKNKGTNLQLENAMKLDKEKLDIVKFLKENNGVV